MLVTEMWMDRIAHMTEQPLQSIRQLNLYQEQDKTHYGQILHKCQVQVCTPCIAKPCPCKGSIENVVSLLLFQGYVEIAKHSQWSFQARYIKHRNCAQTTKCGLSALVGAVSALVSLQSTGTCMITLTSACHVSLNALG